VTEGPLPAPQSEVRVPALDGIRGLAIALVVPHNSSLLLDVPAHGLAYPLKEAMLFGWAGVQLFFVLSGFLITGALLDSQQSPGYYRAFYARRALRILPLYLAVLVVTFLILAPLRLLPAQTLESQQHQIWLWTFLSNWTDPLGWQVSGFSHFWSLAVEEQFYLLWPLVLLRMRPQRLLAVCAGICLVALLARIAMRIAGCSPESLYEFTICRMDALAIGAAAAAMLRVASWNRCLQRWVAYLPAVALLVLVAFALLTHDFKRTGWQTQTFGMTVLAGAFGLLVLGAAGMRDPRATWASRCLCFAPLRSLGKYSYAMYVFHFPLHKLLGVRLLGPLALAPSAAIATVYAGCVMLVSFVLAWASYQLYEQHFLRLKRYFRAGPRVLAGTVG